MVKASPKAVDPIVAIQAGGAKGLEMILGEGSVHLTVAGLTGVRREAGDIGLVAVRTGERLVLGSAPVSVQRESQQLVRELSPCHHRQRRIRAQVFRMARPAFQLRVFLVYGAMQGDHIPHLDRDLPMAVHTTIGHRIGLPRRRMAGLAATAGLRV